MNTIISSIIASTVVATIISSLVSYRLKTLEFRNEYYKHIIKKRLDCYINVERTVLLLQNVVMSEDRKLFYHDIFTTWSLTDEFKEAIRTVIYNRFWLSNDTSDIIQEINKLFIRLENDFKIEEHNDSVMAGLSYYNELELLKSKLETACRYDLLRLHKIK